MLIIPLIVVAAVVLLFIVMSVAIVLGFVVAIAATSLNMTVEAMIVRVRLGILHCTDTHC